jgi:amidase
VHEAARHFATLGAEVGSVSVPAHRDGQAILVALAIEGAYATLVLGNGMGHGWSGFYNSHLLEYFSRAMPRRANDLSPSAKSFLFLGGHIHNNYHGKYYAKAQNLRRTFAAGYDEVFRQVDLLLLPATPMKASELPPDDCGPVESVHRSFEMFVGTGGQFNITGMPAITVPCAVSDGLPVGMALAGRRFEDGQVLNAAHAFEESTDWAKRSPS